MNGRGPALSLHELRKSGEDFLEAISREYYLAFSGSKAAAELQPIYDRYPGVVGADSLALARDLFQGAAPHSDAQRSARLLLDWQAETQSARELAPLDEREIRWETQAVVRLPDGRGIPFQSAAIDMANAADRRERLDIEAARARLVLAELAPIRRERFERERDITQRLGLANDYNTTFELLNAMSLSGMRQQCETFLADTDAMWRDVCPDFIRRALGITPAEATRADALALFRARQFDRFFPGESMESAIRAQVQEMGLDPNADGRIVFDTAPREGKRSRAFCAPVRVPAEVYLVMRPHGGQSDWTTFLHELGHALHYANARPELPFEFRWLGDNSITEGYAMLFDHLMKQRPWLLRYTGLEARSANDYLRAAGFEELHFLRRYCAKLLYEMDLYGGDVPWEALPDLYVQRMTDSTTFRYLVADAFVDVDPRYYSARYLRAWQLQALLGEALTERYDTDWWRNPRSGPWVGAELFAEGQRETADEQATRIAGKTLSFEPLVRHIERLLS